MTRILHLELSTGASGDKILGALLEASEALDLASFEDLVRVGRALVPQVNIERSRVKRSGIAATHLVIEEPEAPVRTMREIRELIETAVAQGSLSPSAARLALETFSHVAKAEAAVHNRPVDHVHFHEVGAADSIIDIVGSCFLFDALAPDAVYATPLALGFGSVSCSHGIMPVPAPATARIIQGLPVYAGTIESELTTPTGAALVHTLVTQFASLPSSRIQTLGYGAGSKDFVGVPNIVRVLVGDCGDDSLCVAESTQRESSPQCSAHPLVTLEDCVLLESNIDHRSPEALAFICDDLLVQGALDVWQEPITMKKGRLAVKLCALCYPAEAVSFSAAIIKASGTLGVRQRPVKRVVAPRMHITLETPYGPVPFKLARLIDPPDETVLLRPEHDAVSALARKHQLDYQELYEELFALGETEV